MESGPKPHRNLLEGARVLVIEDELLVALDLETTLNEAGAEIIGPCATLRHAVEMAEHESLSAATLDVRSGNETTEAVAERLIERHVPFHFYSGQSLPKCIQSRWPACTIIAKPANAEVLIAAVATLLKVA